MVLAWLPAPAVAVPAAVCQWSLEGLTGLVGIAEQLPGSHFWVSGPPVWSVVGFYGFVAMCLAVPLVRQRWKHCLIAATVIFFVSWTVTQQVSHHRPQSLELTFLSVGHGTCVIIELPDAAPSQRFWIYDAGRLGTSRYAVQEISSFLWSRGANHIEGLLLSHADVDHFNAIPGLADRFSIGMIYTTTPFLRNRQPAAAVLFEALEQHGIPVRRVSAGDTIAASKQVELRILHPHDRFVGVTDNEQSIVVCLEHQARRILLPGDLEGEGMECLLASACLDCDLVMAPHHGSHHSEPQRFCDWATPEWVVISGGQQRVVEKGTSIFEQHGATVLRTTEHGAVAARIDDGVLRVTAHRAARRNRGAKRSSPRQHDQP
jgi:competence protein ComEC